MYIGQGKLFPTLFPIHEWPESIATKEMDEEEEILIWIFTLDEALELTRVDYRCDLRLL